VADLHQCGQEIDERNHLGYAPNGEAARRVDEELSKQVKDLTGGLPGLAGMKIPGMF